MSKIKVLVKDKNTLELLEKGNVGDIIDLKEITQIDLASIESLIDSEKDKLYKTKLSEYKRLIDAEYKTIINELESKNKQLKENNIKDLSLKEKEIESKYLDIINELKTTIKMLKADYETKTSKMKAEIEIQNNKTTSDLKQQVIALKAENENIIKVKELELVNKYSDEINELKKKLELSNESKKEEINQINLKKDLEKEKEINELIQVHNEELRKKEEYINILERQKGSLDVKTTGEDLETWCDNEVTSYMQNGLVNCVWYKDNETVKKGTEDHGTKADFIFKIYANEQKKEKELLADICLEMKNENPNTKKKQTNKHFFEQLDQNRNKKKCKYALLVSNLEMDKPNVLPMFKVQGYENMYVVRPAYLMTFLNIITSITTKFSDLVLNNEKGNLELKNKIELVEEFENLKKQYLDLPLEEFEKEITSVSEICNKIRKETTLIDTHLDKLRSNFVNKLFKKLNEFSIKYNNQIIKQM